MRLAWLAMGLMVMPAYAADTRLHDAETAIGRGDLITGMRLLRAAAMSGDAASQARLGQILDKAEEDKEAVEWYRKAADQGHAAGQYGLAMEYYTGEGTARDVVQALAWLRLAAAQNHPSALQTLAGVGKVAHLASQAPTPAAPAMAPTSVPLAQSAPLASSEPIKTSEPLKPSEPLTSGAQQAGAVPLETPPVIPVMAPNAQPSETTPAAEPPKPVTKTKSTPKIKERKR